MRESVAGRTYENSSAELQESQQQRAAYLHTLLSGFGFRLAGLADAMTLGQCMLQLCCVGSARTTIGSVRDRSE